MRRLLVAAFALSILIHLAGVRLVHWSVPAAQDVPETTTLSHITIVRRAAHTPPPATPRPVAAPPVRAPLRIPKPVLVPRLKNRSGPAPRRVAATETPTPAPTPTPTPKPTPAPSIAPKAGCVRANAPAAVKLLAPQPDLPAAARLNAKNGVVTRIHLRLSETGEVLEAGILSSSGSDAQDQVALAQAKSSLYSPALSQCKAVAGTYDFAAKFMIP